jgi:hypothetical protein
MHADVNRGAFTKNSWRKTARRLILFALLFSATKKFTLDDSVVVLIIYLHTLKTH